MSSIDDLPPEMICELFRHLKPRDLVACSMVNKRWRSIFSGFKIHRLAVTDNSVKFYDRPWQYEKLDDIFAKWSYPDRRIKVQEVCQLKVFLRLVDQPLLSNLKHLALSERRLDVNELNGLLTGNSQLMHLELNVQTFSRKELNLKLPKLRVLAFHQLNWECYLSVDCPELNVLVYREHPHVNKLEVKHPETIRKLETNMVGEKLAPFQKVECLVTLNEALNEASKNSLLILPKLKELHYGKNISFDKPFYKPDQMKRLLREFFADVKKLKGSDFQFTVAGFQINETVLDQIDFGEPDRQGYCLQSDEWVYIRNYQLIAPDADLGFIRTMNYSALMSVAKGKLPSCFSKKFTGIQTVFVGSKIQNANHFLRFLRSLSLLRSLNFNDSCLSQEFYVKLPASAPYLHTLILTEAVFGKKRQQISFRFLSKFSRLTRFTIQNKICLETFESCLVICLAKFKEGCFQFLFRGKKGLYNYISKKEGSQSYELFKGSEYIFEKPTKTKNPDEILNHFRDRF